MSTDSLQRAPRHHTAPKNEQTRNEEMRKEIEAFFARVAASGPQPRLRTLTGVCQFDIAGMGTWRATIKQGVVTVTKDGATASPANCVVSCDAKDFLRIVRQEGHLNIYCAVMQELVHITGDVSFAYAILGAFELKPRDARARS